MPSIYQFYHKYYKKKTPSLLKCSYQNSSFMIYNSWKVFCKQYHKNIPFWHSNLQYMKYIFYNSLFSGWVKKICHIKIKGIRLNIKSAIPQQGWLWWLVDKEWGSIKQNIDKQKMLHLCVLWKNFLQLVTKVLMDE